MKRNHLIIYLFCVIIFVIAVLLVKQNLLIDRLREELANLKTEKLDVSVLQKSSGRHLNEAGSARSRRRYVVGLSNEALTTELEKTRKKLKALEAELADITRPMRKNVSSSTVSATLNYGETLVTGGFQESDGSYSFTFLTAEPVELADGQQTNRFMYKRLSLSKESMEQVGLDTLATNARNTLQHAEIWSASDVEKTLTEFASNSETSMNSVINQMPSVIIDAQSKATIQVGSYFMSIMLEDLLADGSGYSIRTRIEEPGEKLEAQAE